jgi:hypothetical protein
VYLCVYLKGGAVTLGMMSGRGEFLLFVDAGTSTVFTG